MTIGKTQARIAGACLFILALLSVFQEHFHIKLEASTILTFALAIILFLLPDNSSLSKIKVGEVELEFEREVKKLEVLINKEETTSHPVNLRFEQKDSWQYYYNEYQAILNSSSSNAEKLLRASQLVEHMILVAGKDFEIDINKRKSPAAVISELVQTGLISDQEFAIYKEFQSLRNKLIHQDIAQLDDTLTIRILDLLLRIVRIFA